jgi:hypothetical protein
MLSTFGDIKDLKSVNKHKFQQKLEKSGQKLLNLFTFYLFYVTLNLTILKGQKPEVSRDSYNS